MITKKFFQAACAVLFVAAAGGAGAQTLSDQGSFGQSVYGNITSGYSPGRLMKWNGGTQFYAYCIDPKTGTDFTQTYTQTTLDSFMDGTATSGYASEIGRSGYSGMGLSNSATKQQTALNDMKELFSYAFTDSKTSTAKAAAFGWAVWEIITQNYTTSSGSGSTLGGTNYAINTGTITSTGGDTTAGNTGSDSVEYWMNQYLGALNGTITWASLGLSTATSWTYTVYYDASSPFAQNFLTVTSGSGGGTGGSVPVPATAALVLLGLAAAAALRKRTA